MTKRKSMSEQVLYYNEAGELISFDISERTVRHLGDMGYKEFNDDIPTDMGVTVPKCLCCQSEAVYESELGYVCRDHTRGLERGALIYPVTTTADEVNRIGVG